MPQANSTTIPLAEDTKAELVRRKRILSKRRGKNVSFDDVLRELLTGARTCR